MLKPFDDGELETSIVRISIAQLRDALASLPAIFLEKSISTLALQLPAGLIKHYGDYVSILEKRFSAPVVLLLRPTYGACDIPSSALESMGVTHVVHLGHSSMPNLSTPLPTLFVPVTIQVNGEIFSHAIKSMVKEYSLAGENLILTSTIQYVHLLEQASSHLKKLGVMPLICNGGPRTSLPGQVLGCNFSAACSPDTEAERILFIGTGDFHPRGIAISTRTRVLALDPHTSQVKVIDGTNFLKRRAAVALSLSDKKRFMIVSCPRPGQNRDRLAKKLVRQGKARGYDCIQAMLDEFRPEYFIGLGLDGIVSTACPRLAYDDTGSYPAPVLTPGEFRLTIGEIALDRFGIDELQ